MIPPATRMVDSVRRARADPLYVQSLMLIVAAGMSAGAGFVFWVICARVAPAESVGKAAGVVSGIALVNYVTSVGFPYGLLRYGAREHAGQIVGLALSLTIATSIIGACVYSLGAGIWAQSLRGIVGGVKGVGAVALITSAVAAGLALDSIYASRRRAYVSVVTNCVVGLSRIAILVVARSSNASTIVWAIFAPTCVVYALSMAALPRLTGGIRWERLHPLFAEGKAFLRYSIAVYPASLVIGSPTYVLPVLALGLFGPRGTAYFFVPWSIIKILALAPSLIGQIALSEGAKQSARVMPRALKASVMLMTAATVGTVVVARNALAFYGQGYSAHAPVLQVLALSLVPAAIIATWFAQLRLEGRFRTLGAWGVSYAAAGLGGSVIGGVLRGLTGFAAGWTTGTFAAGLAVMWVTKSFSRGYGGSAEEIGRP